MTKEDLAIYPALKRLYGTALLARRDFSKRSFLLDLFAMKNHKILCYWEETCLHFLKLVLNPDVAALKIIEEIDGEWKSSTFDSRLKDSFLELRVVCDLSKRGVSHIEALTALDNTRTPDFACKVQVEGKYIDACLEVKNVRAPIGVTETFRLAFEQTRMDNHSLSECDLQLEHHWYNTISPEHHKSIVEFVCDLKLNDANVSKALTLNDGVDGVVPIKVRLVHGSGKVVLARPEGGDYPIGPHVRTPALIKQITDKIHRALLQLDTCKATCS